MGEEINRVFVRVDILDLSVLAAEATDKAEIMKKIIFEMESSGDGDGIVPMIQRTMLLYKSLSAVGDVIQNAVESGAVTRDGVVEMMNKRRAALVETVQGLSKTNVPLDIERLVRFQNDPLI